MAICVNVRGPNLKVSENKTEKNMILGEDLIDSSIERSVWWESSRDHLTKCTSLAKRLSKTFSLCTLKIFFVLTRL